MNHLSYVMHLVVMSDSLFTGFRGWCIESCCISGWTNLVYRNSSEEERSEVKRLHWTASSSSLKCGKRCGGTRWNWFSEKGLFSWLNL